MSHSEWFRIQSTNVGRYELVTRNEHDLRFLQMSLNQNIGSWFYLAENEERFIFWA